MAWTDVTTGAGVWSEITVSGGGAVTLYAGMPMGLLLLLTYPIDEIAYAGGTWNVMPASTGSWSLVT